MPVVKFVIETQLLREFDVQVPSDVRLMTLLDSMREVSWRVGLMTSLPS